MIIETQRDFKKNPLKHKRRLEWSVWEDILFHISTAKDDNAFYFSTMLDYRTNLDATCTAGCAFLPVGKDEFFTGEFGCQIYPRA